MKSLKKITLEINDIGQVKGLLNVYEQITAVKMQTVRKKVEVSQIYFRGLAKIAEEVALDLSSFNKDATKNAVIFLSADERLYGDIIEKIMVNFVNFIKEKDKDTDVLVIGKVGQELMKIYAPDITFKTIALSIDKEPTGASNLSILVPELSNYKKITLFYAEYKSLANQQATSLSISGENVAKSGSEIDKSEEEVIRLKNIYEPDVTAIGEKFAKEISASILDQSINENQLAKYASRLMFLDTSLDNIDVKINNLGSQRRRTKKKKEQKKQTERVSRIISMGRII